MLKRMLEISYTDHITNEEVLRRTNSKRELKELILKMKLKYFGHVVRAEKLQRHLMDGRVEDTHMLYQIPPNYTSSVFWGIFTVGQ